MKAACHCGAVRLEAPAPTWVNDCNCTLCRRYGALWAYYERGTVRLLPEYDQTDAYVWGDRREIAFHRCRACGCMTHWSAIGANPPFIRGVNVRMMPALDPASVTVHQTDNGATGWFWTRTDGPMSPSNHPPMSDPSDWR